MTSRQVWMRSKPWHPKITTTNIVFTSAVLVIALYLKCSEISSNTKFSHVPNSISVFLIISASYNSKS